MEEKFKDLYEEIKGNIKDEDSKELWDELLGKAIEYTNWRAKWSLMTVQEKLDKDPSRTSCHDSLIVKFNQLSRYLDSIGVEHGWRKAIGEQRKDIGDFANYIVFREAVSNR